MPNAVTAAHACCIAMMPTISAVPLLLLLTVWEGGRKRSVSGVAVRCDSRHTYHLMRAVIVMIVILVVLLVVLVVIRMRPFEAGVQQDGSGGAQRLALIRMPVGVGRDA